MVVAAAAVAVVIVATVRVCIAGSQSLTATGCHLPYGITQCYLSPDKTECAPP